jgi:hypothetical protein
VTAAKRNYLGTSDEKVKISPLYDWDDGSG